MYRFLAAQGKPARRERAGTPDARAFTYEHAGDLWVADVGQNRIEEVSVLPAGSAGGLNLGWRCFEGDEPFELTNKFIDLTLGVFNLLDEEYRTAHSRMDAAGRNVMVGLRVNI